MFSTKGARSRKPPKLTKDYVLERVSETEIMAKYLNIPVNLDGNLVRSPLRADKKPTCLFSSERGGIYFTDFSGDFRGDCFDVVQRVKDCNYNIALEQIAIDFGFMEGTPIKYDKNNPSHKYIPKEKRLIQTKRRSWNKEDKAYWTRFNISKATLEKYFVIPLDCLWIDEEIRYNYMQSDLAYAYYFGEGKYKIYFPNRTMCRFLSNGNHVQGFAQLDLTADRVIVTKSLKDTMALVEMGFASVSVPAEGQLIPDWLAEFLEDYETYIFFDNDDTGIKWAKLNSEQHSLPYFHLPEEDDLKDSSDLSEEYGLEKSREIINQLIQESKEKWLTNK